MELRYALAEADADQPPAVLRARVLAAALAGRAPGRPAQPAGWISGLEVFRRAMARLDGLLEGLAPFEWARPALRNLDVQALVGHLIGVEAAFASALELGALEVNGDHISSTEPASRAQTDRPGIDTHQDWSELCRRSIALVTERAEPDSAATWYGITMPLDQLLVVRAFEYWLHEGDIRSATGRSSMDPDPPSLARMTDLAVSLLPVGVAAAGRARPGRVVRLVLTGPCGGAWDVPLDPEPQPPSRPDTRIVVDAAAFCRVVGNRADQSTSGAVVSGDLSLAGELLVGAATLALD